MYSLCHTFSVVDSVPGRLLWKGQSVIKLRVLQADQPPQLMRATLQLPLTSGGSVAVEVIKQIKEEENVDW